MELSFIEFITNILCFEQLAVAARSQAELVHQVAQALLFARPHELVLGHRL